MRSIFITIFLFEEIDGIHGRVRDKFIATIRLKFIIKYHIRILQMKLQLSNK